MILILLFLMNWRIYSGVHAIKRDFTFSLLGILFCLVFIHINQNQSVRIKWEGYWIVCGQWLYAFGFVLPHACAMKIYRVDEQRCANNNNKNSIGNCIRSFTFNSFYALSSLTLCWWSSDVIKQKTLINESTRIVFKGALSCAGFIHSFL